VTLKILILATLAILGTGCSEKATRTPQDPVGRFSVCSGEFELIGNGQTVRLKALFKIDSQTGAAWQLVTPTGQAAYWSRIDDFPPKKPAAPSE
jgi:hypothetical protein